MRKVCICCICCIYYFSTYAQSVFSLDDFRRMAIENNAELKTKKEEVHAAQYMSKAAQTQYLPKISAMGAYVRNSDNLSLLSEDKFAPVGTLMPDGSFGFVPDQINNQWADMNGQKVPLDAQGEPFDPKKNPEKIEWKGHAFLPKEEFMIDNKNVFMGAISLLQPVFMGGRIRELNKIAGYTENLAKTRQEESQNEILYSVDVAYWQVVSVSNRLKLINQYKRLIERLEVDVQALVDEGVSTSGDLLNVKVKVNEADLNVIKAENGLSLSRMALCHLAGLPLDTPFSLVDEDLQTETFEGNQMIEVEEAFHNRTEIRQLNDLIQLSHANVKLQQAHFKPTIGLTANYLWTNPNPYNGFKNEFGGSWNVGVVLNLPIFHWGERVHTLNAAKAQKQASLYRLDEAKSKIELQIQQASYKIAEANKRLLMTTKNIEHAQENLKTAEIGFQEGVIPLSGLMDAQTAWQSAQVEKIDASIDYRLCLLYLQKSLGHFNNEF